MLKKMFVLLGLSLIIGRIAYAASGGGDEENGFYSGGVMIRLAISLVMTKETTGFLKTPMSLTPKKYPGSERQEGEKFMA